MDLTPPAAQADDRLLREAVETLTATRRKSCSRPIDLLTKTQKNLLIGIAEKNCLKNPDPSFLARITCTPLPEPGRRSKAWREKGFWSELGLNIGSPIRQ